MTEYSRYQFAAFRFLLGIGSFFFFLFLPPYAPELTEARSLGIPLHVLGVESPFAALSTVAGVRMVLLALAITSALLAIGIARRFLAPVLLTAFIASTGTIPLVPGPHDGFLPFLLLIALVTPHGEALALVPTKASWNAPHRLLGAARFLFPLGLIIYAIWRVSASNSPDRALA